jgi:DNA-nicking Smr family endonuclease
MTRPDNPDEDFERLLAEFMPNEAVIREKEDGLLDDEERRTQNIIKKYPTNPQDTLDLHNHIGNEAKRAIGFFIERSRLNRLKTVRIITGKGLHSNDGKSVLRGITEEKIAELKKAGLVLSFKWEQGKMAKSGSMIVYIN